MPVASSMNCAIMTFAVVAEPEYAFCDASHLPQKFIDHELLEELKKLENKLHVDKKISKKIDILEF